MSILKEMKRSLVLSAIIYICLGMIMLFFPVFVNNFFSTIIGLLLLFFGLSKIIIYVQQKSYSSMATINLGLGVFATIFGTYILINPEFITSIIPLFSGIIIIINALNRIKQAMEFKTVKYSRWWYNLIAALILLGFGLLLIANPFGAVAVFIRILGGILIVDGIYNLVIIFMYSRDIKKIVGNIK